MSAKSTDKPSINEKGRDPQSGTVRHGGNAERGRVDDQVSNDLSDAQATPEDKEPKDNSHNFS